MRALIWALSFLILISCVSIAISTDSGDAHAKDPDTDKKITIGVSNDQEGREDRGTGRIGDEINHQDEPQADHDPQG